VILGGFAGWEATAPVSWTGFGITATGALVWVGIAIVEGVH